MEKRTRFLPLLRVLAILWMCGAVHMAYGAGGSPWPDRPVRLLVPFAPGGGVDTFARTISPKLSTALRQQWVIDNRPGAAGNIATEIVAKANPDGHTVLLGQGTTLTVNPSLYKMPVDIARDLQPVVMLTASQYMMVVHPSLAVKSLRELVDLAKAKPGALNYGSTGVGSPLHLAAELFKARAGIDMAHVPYKGGAPAVAAVLGGEIQALIVSLPSALPHVRAGKLTALGVTGPARSAVAPDIPTIAESGFPGFEVTSWYGLLVPAKTPERIVKMLQDEALKMVRLADVREQLLRQGLDIATRNATQFAAQIKSETEVWAKVVKAAGIRAE